MAEEKVMELACCSKDQAVDALSKTNNDIVDAVTLLMNIPKAKDAPKERELNELQKFFKETRDQMSILTNSISKGYRTSNSSDQSVPSEHSEKQTLPEEMVQQNNCSPESPLLAQELMVQIPEIACPSQSGCSSGLPLNDQKLPDSDLQCHQSTQVPEKE
jgi:hypothetical protein